MKVRDYTLLELKNFALCILTLGIYSAWAKVRRRKYVTQHTLLDDHAFDYVARPQVILRSRVLVMAILVASSLSEQLHPTLGFFGSLALVLAFPWAYTTSTAFNARQTQYRGHSFLFSGSIKEAYTAFFKSYGITLVTLGIGQFVSMQLFSSFVGNNSKFAGRRFSFEQPRGPYYKLGALFAGSLCLFVVVFVLWCVLPLLLDAEMNDERMNTVAWLQGALIAAMGAGYLFLAGAVRASLANLFFEGLSYGPHTLRCQIKPRTLGTMYLTNTIAILGTLGLAIPWAYLRSYRYRMSCLTVLAQGALLDASATKAVAGDDEADAIGDAFLDLGFDFGL